MFKHAYLIIAHQDIKQLMNLVRAIDSPKNDIFIHFDNSKVNKYDLSHIKTKHSSLEIISEIKVHWASYSIVKCELLLLKKAMNHNRYSYFHLLSGADYLIKPIDYIYDFFEKSQKEFILFSQKELSGEIKDWTEYKHLMSEIFNRYNFKLINKFIFGIDNILIRFQKLLKIKSKIEYKLIQKGSQWFSITYHFANYILSEETRLEKNFRWSFCPDEIVIQTLIINSSFRSNIYKYDKPNDISQNMRLIDWKRGKPYTFRINDYNQIENSKCLFARKFNSSIDENIVNKISRTLL